MPFWWTRKKEEEARQRQEKLDAINAKSRSEPTPTAAAAPPPPSAPPEPTPVAAADANPAAPAPAPGGETENIAQVPPELELSAVPAPASSHEAGAVESATVSRLAETTTSSVASSTPRIEASPAPQRPMTHVKIVHIGGSQVQGGPRVIVPPANRPIAKIVTISTPTASAAPSTASVPPLPIAPPAASGPSAVMEPPAAPAPPAVPALTPAAPPPSAAPVSTPAAPPPSAVPVSTPAAPPPSAAPALTTTGPAPLEVAALSSAVAPSSVASVPLVASSDRVAKISSSAAPPQKLAAAHVVPPAAANSDDDDDGPSFVEDDTVTQSAKADTSPVATAEEARPQSSTTQGASSKPQMMPSLSGATRNAREKTRGDMDAIKNSPTLPFNKLQVRSPENKLPVKIDPRANDSDDTASFASATTPTDHPPPLPNEPHHKTQPLQNAKQRNRLPAPERLAADLTHATTDPSQHDVSKRLWVQERFSRLLCPQQYFGRVIRIHNVKLGAAARRSRLAKGPVTLAAYAVRDGREAAQLLSPNGFEGATAEASAYAPSFSTQVQLDPVLSRKAKQPPQRTSTFALCEIPNARARFAETLADAAEVLENHEVCFVTELSAFVVSSLSVVSVYALIDVTWIPFSAEPSPTCEIHRIPLQLFDPVHRNLLCALCSANDSQRASTVVLSDLFSGSSLRNIRGNLKEKLDSITARLATYVAEHRQISTVADRRRQAVELQFSLVQAALKAKREELLELLDEEERRSSAVVTKQIFSHNEIKRHIHSALVHLRQFAEANGELQPFAQMATVVSSLGVATAPPQDASSPGNVASPRRLKGNDPSAFKLNLEHVIRSITEISFGSPGPSSEPVEVSPLRNRRSEATMASRITSPSKTKPRPQTLNSSSLGFSAPGSSPAWPSSANRVTSPKRRTVDVTTVGPGGTVLFDIDISQLLSKLGAVEWKLRIDDPGTWIGIGARVGDDPKVDGNRHIWIAPTNVPRIIRPRVVIGPHGHAKMTIHDSLGRQLDDNRIPHWIASRPAFPQVSFGAEPGSVTMVEPPRVTYQHSI